MNLFNENKSFNLILLLYFVLLPFVFFSSILDPFLLARQLLTTILLLFITLLLLKNINTKNLFTLDITTLLFFGFIIFCGLSFLKSQSIDSSHATFSKFITFFMFFLLIKHVISNNLIKISQIQLYVIIFGVLSLFIAALAFTNKTISGQNLFRQVNAMSGTFGNKNFLSSILFICLPFYFVGVSISKKIKIVSIVAIFFTVILLVMLRTRTVLIALSLYLFLILCYYLKNKFSKKIFFLYILSLITIAVIVIYYFFSIKNNLHSSSDVKTQYFYRLLSSNTFFSRLEYWQQATYLIKDNFFSGVGVGNWINIYPKYGLSNFSEIDIQNGRMIINSPHNDFLQVFAEIGIFGFLCYIGIFISVLYQAFWLSKNEIERSDRKVASYFLFFIICYLIIAFFDFPLTRIEHQILLLIIFSIINSKYLKAKKPKGFTFASRNVFIFCLLLLVYSFTILFYRINGETHLFNALEAEKTKDNKNVIYELKKAKSSFFTTDNFAIPLDWYVGSAYYNEGNFEESLSYYSDAYKINPYCLVVNNDIASAYIKNENVEEGIKHYKEALNISPNYVDARLNLAATYFNTKQYENAFKTIDACEGNLKNDFYKQILTPIVEKKLNLTLTHINNTNLNDYLKSKIKTENDLLKIYFDYRKNTTTFDKYLQSLIN